MTTPDNKRATGPRTPRPRREPLFELEDDEIAPRSRRGPPAPLGDMVKDIDAALPTAAAPERRLPVARPDSPPAAPARASAAPTATQRQTGARALVEQKQTGTRALVETTTREQRTRPVLRPMTEEEADLRAAHASYDDAEADLRLVEHMTARPYISSRPYISYSRPGLPALPGMNHWPIMGMVAVVSIFILVVFGVGGSVADLSRWVPSFMSGNQDNALHSKLFGAAPPAGNYSLKASPSISAKQIDRILESYGSPATGTGEIWYNLGLKYGIDPAFAVAFFIHESSAGTNPGWAGIKSDGSTTHNVGNIICAGYASCYNRFRDYGSWEEGIEDWYRLIDVEYIQGRGTMTVRDIIPIYAPAFENDVEGYINSVTSLVDSWRTTGVH